MKLGKVREAVTLGFKTVLAAAGPFVLGAYLFSPNNLAFYAIALVPYGVFLAYVGLPARLLLQDLGIPKRVAGALFIGLPAGYLWAVAFALWLGGRLPDVLGEVFRFPLLYFWMVGGFCGVLAAASVKSSVWAGYSTRRRQSRWKPIGLLIATLFAYVLSLAAVFAAISIVPDQIEPEVYLIPDGYIGPVLVVFDQPGGQPPVFDGETRIYNIPPSGVLLTQLPPPKEGIGPELWYVDDEGRKTKPIQFNGSCVSPPAGDAVLACLRGVIFVADGKEVPSHTRLIIAPASKQDEAATGSYEWATEILLTLVQ